MRSLRLRFSLAFFFMFASAFGFALEKQEYKELKRQIKDQYFIVLKQKPVSATQASSYHKNKEELRRIENKINLVGGKVIQKFLHAFVGLHVKMEANSLRMIDDSAIKFTTKNDIAELYSEEPIRSWGIDRVDQRDLPLDNLYSSPEDGTGAHIYTVDTGIRSTHQEFTGRIGPGFSALPDDPSTEDCNIHGTHVSGTAAGSTAGLARGATVHPVRVFGCSGGTPWSVILAGIEWVIPNHTKPAVANFSLGGGANAAVDEAITNLVNAGVTTVVSAGNNNGDACQKSPARAPAAITVAASTISDAKASYSNWGTCVDIIAPGSAIISSGIADDTSYSSLSGTSMSSPHVTGAVALLLEKEPNLTPEKIIETLLARASNNKISGFDEKTPNKLLYVKEEALPKPVVDAGKDKIVKFPGKISLVGTAIQKDGKIVKAYWEQVKGQELPSSLIQMASGSWKIPLIIEKAPVGTYLFMLTAENDAGLKDSDTVEVIVTDVNLPPIAKAGKDRKHKITKKNMVLSGQGSNDPDGQIVKFEWKQESGPNQVIISAANKRRAIVKEFHLGSYTFSLTVTDNNGASARDEVTITVVE